MGHDRQIHEAPPTGRAPRSMVPEKRAGRCMAEQAVKSYGIEPLDVTAERSRAGVENRIRIRHENEAVNRLGKK